MRLHHRHPLLPTALELWWVAFVAAAVLVAGNVRFYLEHHGVVGSSAVLHQQVSDQVGHGLRVLDSFRLTAGATTFVVWAGGGVLLLGIIRSAVEAWRALHYARLTGSRAYVHPSPAARQAYRQKILRDTLLATVATVLFVAAAVLYATLLVPTSFSYVRDFLLQTSLAHSGSLAIGTGGLLAGTALLYLLLKVALWRSRHSRQYYTHR